MELFDVATDPSERTNLADQNPAKVAELKKRADELARAAVPPLLMKEIMGVARRELLGSTSIPEEDSAVEIQP